MLVAATTAVATTTAVADDKRYTLADLEALVVGSSYHEAVAHLSDIAPAQRTPKWLEVGAAATAGLLGTLPDDAKLLAIDAIDRSYPQLVKTAKYARARAEHGVIGLASCYQSRESECAQLGLRLADGGDRALVLEVARITTVHGNAVEAVSLFKRALATETKKTCRDEQLRRATIAALSRTAPATDARAIVQTCWDDVKDAVVQAFDQAGKGSEVYKNTCDILEAKRALSSLQLKRCRTK